MSDVTDITGNPIHIPKTKWIWDMFGTGVLVFHLTGDTTWLARMFFRLVLNSKWEKAPNDNTDKD